MKAKKIDKDGLLLCELQARAFELSATQLTTSSAVFIRRFMNSVIVKQLDNGAILDKTLQPKDLLSLLTEEYGTSNYGSVVYTKNELYWMGYIYRYMAYTYAFSSHRAYGIVKPGELRGLFLPYHTMDPAQASDRILEAKGLLFDEEAELHRQFEIYKRIRSDNPAKTC